MTPRLQRAPILFGALALALAAGCAQTPSIGLGGDPAPAAQPEWPTADVPISDMDKARIQASLNKLGYDAGTVDGFIGRQSREAIRAYQADIGAPANGHYSPKLVSRLQDEAGPVSIARQPEAAADIRGSSIILAALIEGVALFGAVVTLLIAL